MSRARRVLVLSGGLERAVPKARVFLFDVDGVLVIGPKWSVDVERDWGIPPAELQAFFATDFEACIRGERDLPEVLAPWCERWGIAGGSLAFMAYWFEKDAYLNGPALACARQHSAHGTCYLATNQERHRARYLMEGLGLGETFAGIFPSCRLGAAKPDARFFEGIARALAARHPEGCEVHFVDDLEKNAIAAAAIGWKAHWYRSQEGFEAWISGLGLT